MKTIYIEAEEFFIKKILKLARINLGKSVNTVNLTPCIDKQEVIEKLKKIEEESCSLCEDDLQEYLKELEDAKSERGEKK